MKRGGLFGIFLVNAPSPGSVDLAFLPARSHPKLHSVCPSPCFYFHEVGCVRALAPVAFRVSSPSRCCLFVGIVVIVASAICPRGAISFLAGLPFFRPCSSDVIPVALDTATISTGISQPAVHTLTLGPFPGHSVLTRPCVCTILVLSSFLFEPGLG